MHEAPSFQTIHHSLRSCKHTRRIRMATSCLIVLVLSPDFPQHRGSQRSSIGTICRQHCPYTVLLTEMQYTRCSVFGNLTILDPTSVQSPVNTNRSTHSTRPARSTLVRHYAPISLHWRLPLARHGTSLRTIDYHIHSLTMRNVFCNYIPCLNANTRSWELAVTSLSRPVSSACKMSFRFLPFLGASVLGRSPKSPNEYIRLYIVHG